MKDKAIVLLASLIVLLATSCGQVQEKIEFEKAAIVNKYQDYTQKNISAKLIDFNGIKDLEDQTENIIKVRKIKTIDKKTWDGPDAADTDPGLVTGTTFIEVEVLENYKGGLKAGDSIKVEEDYYYNDISKTVFTTEGYVAMKDGEEYLLLINKNEDYYYIVGVLPGQIPIQASNLEEPGQGRSLQEGSSTEKVTINSNYPEDIQELQREVANKYLGKDKK